MLARAGGLARADGRSWPTTFAGYVARKVARRRRRDPALRLLGRRALAGALPRARRAVDARASSRPSTSPTIHFGTGAADLLEELAAAGGDVIGLDWRLPLDEGWARVPDRAVQGNLDPAVLLAPWDVVEREALDVLARGRRPARARLQPRPRRAPGDRSRSLDAARRARARADGAPVAA